MAEDVFTLTVAFDDGPAIEVGVKQRDMLRLEELDRELAVDAKGEITQRLSHVPMLAWLALQRMSRRDALPDGVTLPETFDEFRDVVDVEGGEEPPDPSSPAPSTGS